MTTALTAFRESQLIVILDDDAMITEGLAAGLERDGRTIITCNDLESAEMVVERMKPSHVVSDVRLSGPFGFEGLDFLRFIRQHSPESRVVLMTGDVPDALQLEASERGAVGFLRKPFDISELDASIDLLTCSSLSASAVEVPVIRMPMLDDILTNGGLRSFFQPIVELSGGNPRVGFEALARYLSNSLFRDPDVLFQYASRKERLSELELACLTRNLRSGAPFAAGHSLFLNVHPYVLSTARDICGVILGECARLAIEPARIILEITEQGSLKNGPQLFENVGKLHDAGIRFAFDDVGVAYSHLPFIDRLRPSFLKISQEFGTGFEQDATKMKIVINILSLAREFDCDLILEGVEEPSTAEMAQRIGIKYGQGYLFGRPAEASEFN